MPPTQTRVSISTGGIVLNTKGEVLLVAQNGGSWSFPKGHVDPGEEPIDAAAREILEETGVTELHFLKILGSYGRYKIGKNSADDKSEWKVLLFFLFKTKQMELKPLDPNHPQARWINPNDVENLLTHPKDKAFFKSIRSQI